MRLPEGLRSVPHCAFANCASIANVQLPEGLESIETGAFIDCAGLITLDLPESLTSISITAFLRCTGLRTLVLPTGLRSIDNGHMQLQGVSGGTGAFAWCANLVRVLAPDVLVRGGMANPADVFERSPVLCSGLTPFSAVKIPRRRFWHPTMHVWCTGVAKACVFAVLVAELRVDRQEDQRLSSLPHELWLLILEFVARRDLGALGT